MSKFRNLIVGILILGSGGLFLLFPFITKVKTECRTQYGVCPQELESGIRNQKSSNLYQTKKNVSKYLEKDLLVSDFSTQFKFPNVLLVNILIKKPVFLLKNNSNQMVEVGEDGQVLGISNGVSLPTVVINGNLKNIGEKIDENQLFSLKLIQGINEMYQINAGEIKDNSLVVELPVSIKVIFPLDGDADILLGSLRIIYTKIEGGDQKDKYREIDLRFKNPVLR